MLLLTATAIYMSVLRFDYWAGFVTATVAGYWGSRLIGEFHKRWLREHGYEEVITHRRIP
jgi:hypothetical protein